MLLTGLANLYTGISLPQLSLGGLTVHGLQSFSHQQSVAILGHGAQVLFAVASILVGFALLWRFQVAWTYAVLLLVITIGIHLFRGEYGLSLLITVASLAALLVWRSTFSRKTLIGGYLISLAGVVSVLVYGTLGTLLLGRDFHPKVSSLGTALYFTIVTLSTVGYGDITPANQTSRIFVITLIVLGISIFTTVLLSSLGPSITLEMAKLFSPQRRRIMLNQHVILVGSGALAASTALELKARQLELVQVIAPEKAPPLPEEPYVQGDPSTEETLRKAGAQRARLLIAAREDDNENAFITLAAKNLAPGLKVLAIASSARSMRILKLAGADLVFSPVALGSRLLANLVQGEELPADFQDLLT
jgi:voltage-gated potassium channel